MRQHWLDENSAAVRALVKAIEEAGWGIRQLDVEMAAVGPAMPLSAKITAIPKDEVA